MVDPHCRVAVYPGSFDPITLGHLNVMERASTLFDRLIVGVGVNMEKEPMFDGDERMRLIREATSHLENVEIQTFYGLAVEFVRECGSRVMVRGVRPITDIPAELTMMMANRRLAPEIETLFMIADGDLAHVSSSLIKQIAPLGRRRRTAPFPARLRRQGRPRETGRAEVRVGWVEQTTTLVGLDRRLNVTSSPTATRR